MTNDMVATYTVDEVANIMHVHKHQVMMWKNECILNGIKTGKGYVFSVRELIRFQDLYTGYDISNPTKIEETNKIIREKNNESGH